MAMLKIKSLEDQIFEIDLEFAKCCPTIKNVLDYLKMGENEDYDTIPLRIEAGVMETIVEWAEFHKNNPPLSEGDEKFSEQVEVLKSWTNEFFEKHHDLLFEIIVAANFLKHEKLIELSCEEAEKHVYRKTAAELRRTFNLLDDITDDEKRQIKRNQKLYNRRKAMK